MLKDTLSSNLKILSLVEENSKLIIRGYNLSIDQSYAWLQPFTRYIRSDNRHDIVRFLLLMIDTLEHVYNFSTVDDELAYTEYTRLLKDLKTALIGINKQKKTYRDDSDLISNLSVAISKYNRFIHMIETYIVSLKTKIAIQRLEALDNYLASSDA